MGKKTAAFMVTGTLLVAACGDDGGGDSAFCDSFKEFNEEWGQNDVQERPDEFADAARAIDPPGEIADEWNTFVENITTVSSAADMQEELADDPEAMQEAVNDMQEAQTAIEEAGTTIDQYANDNCDYEISGVE